MSWSEYDPLTGVHEKHITSETSDLITVRKSQNVQGLLDRNAELRATRATDIGIKKGLWHYASVPLVVQYELLTKYGLNIHDKNHTDRIYQVINRDYPALKTTDKTHSRMPTNSRTKASLPKLGTSPSDTSPIPTLIIQAR